MGMLFSTSKKSKNKSKAAKRGTLTFDTTGCDKVCPMIAEKKKTGVSDYGGRIVVARRVYAVEQENGSVEGEFSVVRWGVWEARESGSFGRTPGGMRVEEGTEIQRAGERGESRQRRKRRGGEWRRGGEDTGGSSFRRSEEFFQRQPCTEQTSKQQTARGINRGTRSRARGSRAAIDERYLWGGGGGVAAAAAAAAGMVPGRVWAGLGWAGIRDRTGMYMANNQTPPPASQPAARPSHAIYRVSLLRCIIYPQNLDCHPLIDGGNDFKPGCGEKSK
ncbi:predicted protein [Histoplasma capsulatum G186AR]|uniref:Uncharacterized protein n=1 Tax=Ajellomyces capsulatus (strain G186AR / H82 / ATCC MYA-2454 / RMSCC 2432) TaxID=447093 RepID=C0NQU2_AJECG|nr:uncharacterized protein HCBG_05372 [Histoplasma capsulatum G186AR]EEH06056.1 predicted protein [Histoplasma capsulatum G186AR]